MPHLVNQQQKNKELASYLAKENLSRTNYLQTGKVEDEGRGNGIIQSLTKKLLYGKKKSLDKKDGMLEVFNAARVSRADILRDYRNKLTTGKQDFEPLDRALKEKESASKFTAQQFGLNELANRNVNLTKPRFNYEGIGY